MYWSKLFIPTLRENPAEAEVVSHQLLLRAGYIRQLAAGVYNYLFLAQRSILKITAIVREEMDAIGAQEMLLPALNPAEVWQESGRWTIMGDNMFRLKDRFGRDMCLGMTHEEVMTSIARGELRSYKQMPQIWYQIQTKFRDEPRPKSGLLRVRQFIMKDSYSFDMGPEGLDVAYNKHRDAYCRIFERCGLQFVIVEADSGAMGGSKSNEFMVRSEAGEDFVVECKGCGYAANLEKAVGKPSAPLASDPEGDLEPEEFHTPGQKTIAEIAAFTGLPETSQMKSLVMAADGTLVLALVRGDHQLSETKFASAVGAVESDNVQVFNITSGHWLCQVQTYTPSTATGIGYFIMLNTYANPYVSGGNWSIEIHFETSSNLVTSINRAVASGGPGNTTAALITNQWVPLVIDIDLAADTFSATYGGNPLVPASPLNKWSQNVSAAVGVARIQCIDLYSQMAGFRWDDLSLQPVVAQSCYANCDGSTSAPCLNVNDFICFNNLYAASSTSANCDGSTIAPILNVNDFICFNNLYAAGCTNPCAAP